MVTRKAPRKGSLQYWPRKRINKFLPNVNWDAIDSSSKILKGFIAYKAGMMSALVKDNTADSMTKGKQIAFPVTILECPSMKIFSVRFYKNTKVMKEVLAENLDKELKRKLKLPKTNKKFEEVKEEYDDLKILVYSVVKQTNIKKTPDLVELGLLGSKEDKLSYVKENLGKEIKVSDVFEKGQLVDFRGVTTGKGLCGPLKRFGLKLKRNKSEKGRRRPGSLGPWHPARVTFRVPMAGQMGLFTRAIYNNKIVDINNKQIKNLKNYGDTKCDYLVVRGSVMGPSKRQLVVTNPLRQTKKQSKKNFDLIELR
jgi:large subunit ribosomal protein L3